MLDKTTIEKIEQFVQLKPRNINEIAVLLGRNWRTADAYVARISKEVGTIATRTFRGGTRGALKIVYWNMVDKAGSAVQEALLQRILAGKEKQDFNPFDIYQYVDSSKRRAFLEEQTTYKVTEKQNLVAAMRQAKEQILLFSGDFSWSIAKQGSISLLSLLEDAAKRGVAVKIICDVDLESVENVAKVLSINHKLKRDLIEVRHSQQPLRAFVIDNNLARFKQQKTGKKSKQYLFYELFDESWVEWVQHVFWNIFRSSIGAEQRLQDLESIEHIK